MPLPERSSVRQRRSSVVAGAARGQQRRRPTRPLPRALTATFRGTGRGQRVFRHRDRRVCLTAGRSIPTTTLAAGFTFLGRALRCPHPSHGSRAAQAWFPRAAEPSSVPASARGTRACRGTRRKHGARRAVCADGSLRRSIRSSVLVSPRRASGSPSTPPLGARRRALCE